MTPCDYLMTMKAVGVAELKSHLSEHLRNVRRGHSVTVMDRDTPIAVIIPHRDGPVPLPAAAEARSSRAR
jgi:prevent-host-death family protein